jgi:hypothetical protein
MFFRREKSKTYSFEDYLSALRQAGFTIDSQGDRATVSRDGFAAMVEANGTRPPHVHRAGLLVNGEIFHLLSRGFQMMWEGPGGKVRAALAEELKSLHAFQEDLREELGIISLYNTGLGTVSARHAYDRVAEREENRRPRVWDRAVRN